MKPVDMVAMFDSHTAIAVSALKEATVRGDTALLHINFPLAFSSKLMSALICWRHELEDPRPRLHEAVALAHEALDGLFSLAETTEAPWRVFDFGASAVIAGLLGQNSSALTAAIPRSLLKGMTGYDAPSILDGLLVDALENHHRVSPTWDEAMRRLEREKRLVLVHQTYSRYNELLMAASAGDRRGGAQAATGAAKCFRQRATNSYYAGGRPYFGGGQNNGHAVDFRLALLLRSQFPGEFDALPVGDRFHLWRW